MPEIGELSLSVIIPTFNRADLLLEALRSVYDQTVAPYEIVIVDDGSTDHTADVVAEYVDRVKYMRQDNAGPAAARNAGIGQASGSLIGFLDSDDIWFPEFVESAFRVFREHAGVDSVIFDNEANTFAGEFVASRFAERGLIPGFNGPFSIDAIPPTWAQRPAFGTSAVVIKRESLRRLAPQPFDISLRAYEDWDLELRMYEHLNVLFVPIVLARKLEHTDDTRPNGEMALRARYKVAGRYCRSNHLTARATEELRKTREQTARSLATRFGRARYLDIGVLAATELCFGSPLNAARVLKRGIWDTRISVDT